MEVAIEVRKSESQTTRQTPSASRGREAERSRLGLNRGDQRSHSLP